MGFDLLDRKRNILIREMMALIDRASEIQGQNRFHLQRRLPGAATRQHDVGHLRGACGLGACRRQSLPLLPQRHGGGDSHCVHWKEEKTHIPFALSLSNATLDGPTSALPRSSG